MKKYIMRVRFLFINIFDIEMPDFNWYSRVLNIKGFQEGRTHGITVVCYWDTEL